jgi:hypothetical protein
LFRFWKKLELGREQSLETKKSLTTTKNLLRFTLSLCILTLIRATFASGTMDQSERIALSIGGGGGDGDGEEVSSLLPGLHLQLVSCESDSHR